MGRLLGIDFGIARIGIAISDDNHCIALPIGMIPGGKSMKETALTLLNQVAHYGQIEKIVIGLPLLLNGKEGDMALKVKAFGVELQIAFACPVIYWDERLTSSQVERSLKDRGMNRKQRTKHVDTLAASIILQTYLDSIPKIKYT